MKNRGILFVVSAPSGAGKTTLAEMILQSIPHIHSSVSHTTRSPREGEVEGRDYHFVNRKTFKEMIANGEFLEWAEVFGNLYGTSIHNLDIVSREKKDLLLVIDVQGAEQLRKHDQNGCYIFILPPSLTILEERLRKRALNTEEDIQKRLKTSTEEIAHYTTYDYIIVNEDLEDAVHRLKSIIVAERCRYPNFSPELDSFKL